MNLPITFLRRRHSSKLKNFKMISLKIHTKRENQLDICEHRIQG